jgi:hypothetical protein
MEGLFDKIRKDVKKGIEEGIAAVMQGASVVSVKMNELSDEGKRQYKMFNLHVKIKDATNEMGEYAYAALNNMKSLDEDKKIKAAFTKIRKLEWQLSKLDGGKEIKVAAPNKAAKKPAKKTAKKTAIKK